MPEIKPTEDSRPVRVAIVGVGAVGSTFAYALVLSGLAAEIVLLDANRAKAEGEAMDLNHTVPSPTLRASGLEITLTARERRSLFSRRAQSRSQASRGSNVFRPMHASGARSCRKSRKIIPAEFCW